MVIMYTLNARPQKLITTGLGARNHIMNAEHPQILAEKLSMIIYINFFAIHSVKHRVHSTTSILLKIGELFKR